jgi:hypothetical protein
MAGRRNGDSAPTSPGRYRDGVEARPSRRATLRDSEMVRKT